MDCVWTAKVLAEVFPPKCFPPNILVNNVSPNRDHRGGKRGGGRGEGALHFLFTESTFVHKYLGKERGRGGVEE